MTELGSRDAPYWTACSRNTKQVGSTGEDDNLPDLWVWEIFPTLALLPLPHLISNPSTRSLPREGGGGSGHSQGTQVRNWGGRCLLDRLSFGRRRPAASQFLQKEAPRPDHLGTGSIPP